MGDYYDDAGRTYERSWIDVRQLLRDADADSVLAMCGVDMERRRDRLYFRCPFHISRIGKADKKIGNCSIKYGSKKFYCYSCGAHGDLIDLVQECTNSDFKEAVELIADTCGGGIDAYKVADETGKGFVKDNAKFFKAVHLDGREPQSYKPEYNGKYICEVFTKEEAVAYEEKGYRAIKVGTDIDVDSPDPLRWLILDQQPSMSLGLLRKEDPEAYEALVGWKCREHGVKRYSKKDSPKKQPQRQRASA